MDRIQEIDAYVASRVAKERRQRKISRKRLALALGVSTTQVQKYENGTNRLSVGKLYIIAEVMGLNVRHFLPTEPLHMTDGLTELQIAFNRLPDEHTKHQLLELVKCIAYRPRKAACG